MADYVVIHYGEIAIKGNNRPFFERMLLENIKLAIKDCKHEDLRRISGRLLLKLNKSSDEQKIESALKKVFGITYFALVSSAKQDIEDIKKVAASIIEGTQAKTIRVLTKRSNKQFPLESPEVNKLVGEHLIKKFSFTVDFEDADLSLWIEIVEKYVFIYTQRVDGLGGLPVGVSGKVLALISGGIDSPVAAYLMMKRGCSVKFIHFFNDAINSQGALEKINELIKILSQYNKNTRLHVVPFKDVQFEIIKLIPSQYRMIVYRRMMFRIAEVIARREEAKALVTGDNLAQVASQTLSNMGVIRNATSMLTLTPVLGMDKQEIIDRAKVIGTYETSIQPYEDCCSFYIAKHPEIKGNLEKIEELEKKLDIKNLISLSLEKTL